jgi:D-amino-acid dehydrogenase
MRICVLGGGVVGVATAYYLARDGHEVTVVDQAEGAGLETSFANGGQLSYSYVAPLADPSVIPKLPSWLVRRDSPLRFVPRLELQQWRWGLAFLRACTAVASRAATVQLLGLGFYSRSLVHALVREEQLDFDYVRNGKLVLYRDCGEFEGAKRQMAFQATLGAEQQALSPAACVDLEPALAPLAGVLCGGIHTPSEDAGDCHKFTRGLAAAAAAQGVRFQFGARVQGLIAWGGRVEAARTSLGDIRADAFVMAMGMGSVEILDGVGIAAPLYPINGYSLTLPVKSAHAPPRISITDSHHKIVYALLGDRLRIAGMADVTGLSTGPDPVRLALLARQARETFPDGGDYDNAATWFGRRPATPTSKPIVGATSYANLWLNIGHGALGFTLACGSAKIVADAIASRPPAIAAAGFALQAA